MIQISNAIVSLDILEKAFFCDIGKCKGVCCVHGISGAPLEDEELEIIEETFPVYKKYLGKESLGSIKKQGLYIIDSDGEYVTPLNKGKECAYTIFENGVAKCAIEKAFEKEEISFRKPISCHLYPVRITKHPTFDAVNFDTWDECRRILHSGDRTGAPVYKFVKDALIRKFGADWYGELEHAANNLEIGI